MSAMQCSALNQEARREKVKFVKNISITTIFVFSAFATFDVSIAIRQKKYRWIFRPYLRKSYLRRGLDGEVSSYSYFSSYLEINSLYKLRQIICGVRGANYWS